MRAQWASFCIFRGLFFKEGGSRKETQKQLKKVQNMNTETNEEERGQ